MEKPRTASPVSTPPQNTRLTLIQNSSFLAGAPRPRATSVLVSVPANTGDGRPRLSARNGSRDAPRARGDWRTSVGCRASAAAVLRLPSRVLLLIGPRRGGDAAQDRREPEDKPYRYCRPQV